MSWRILFLLWLLPGLAVAAPTLQAQVDAAPPGSTLLLLPGEYAGPLLVRQSLVIDGGGKTRIKGSGKGTVVRIEGRNVTVRGLLISGSGESHDGVDAGIEVTGHGHRIENNVFEDVLFGIHLRQANDTLVRGNRVHGKPNPEALRGDAIRLWNGSGNRIEDNHFDRARDLTFINAPANRITGNRFTDGRYGMQIVFSPRLLIERNHLSQMATGIVVLYSPDITLRDNRIEHALTGGGAGIVFKESDSGLVEGNTVLHCTVGLKVDAPPDPVGVLEVRGNRFAHNLTGLYFYGEAGGHRISGNRFEKNLVPVAISAPGAGAANVWQANRWDDYQGFDRDHDGTGDTPHELWLYADRLWMETPMASFFRNSPGLELLDFLERLAPFSTPHRVLQDKTPDMRR